MLVRFEIELSDGIINLHQAQTMASLPKKREKWIRLAQTQVLQPLYREKELWDRKVDIYKLNKTTDDYELQTCRSDNAHIGKQYTEPRQKTLHILAELQHIWDWV